MPNRYPIAVVSITNTTAAPVPTRRFRANSIVDFFLPPGSKDSDGTGISTTPVNALSNSSQVILTVPLAGSLIYTYLPLKPFNTTKWFMFQWMMHGNVPSLLRLSGLIEYALTSNP